MDILTNLQEYGVIGAAFTIVLIILKYNKISKICYKKRLPR